MNLKKIAVLAYGSLTYLFFLATYLYTVGFLTGHCVPKHVDTLVGEPVGLGRALAVNAGILGIFAVQHLIMARRWFKRRITRLIPAAAERSTFVLATNLILCALFYFWQPMPQVVWDVQLPLLRALLLGVSLVGFLGVVYATFLIDHFELFGLQQVLRYAFGREHQSPSFQVKNLYRFTRHPLYLFFFLAFWATPTMTLGHLAFALLSTGFIFVGVQFEERGLIAEHGDDYRRYKGRVPMILPRFGRSSEVVRPLRPEATVA